MAKLPSSHMSTKKISRAKYVAVKDENKKLKETLAILSNSSILKDIQKSIHQLERGHKIKLC